MNRYSIHWSDLQPQEPTPSRWERIADVLILIGNGLALAIVAYAMLVAVLVTFG